MNLIYRVVSGEDWRLLHKANYPHAVHNAEKTEYILSCNDGSGELTRKQAQDYIRNNWPKEGEI